MILFLLFFFLYIIHTVTHSLAYDIISMVRKGQNYKLPMNVDLYEVIKEKLKSWPSYNCENNDLFGRDYLPSIDTCLITALPLIVIAMANKLLGLAVD